jgi:hypothetical protein
VFAGNVDHFGRAGRFIGRPRAVAEQLVHQIVFGEDHPRAGIAGNGGLG